MHCIWVLMLALVPYTLAAHLALAPRVPPFPSLRFAPPLLLLDPPRCWTARGARRRPYVFVTGFLTPGARPAPRPRLVDLPRAGEGSGLLSSLPEVLKVSSSSLLAGVLRLLRFIKLLNAGLLLLVCLAVCVCAVCGCTLIV